MGENISITTVSRLESGRIALTVRYMQSIAHALGVPEIDIVREPKTAVKLVPILGSVPAGPLAEPSSLADGWLPIPSSVGGERSFALSPEGDSMGNVAAPGSFIVVDPDQLDLIAGKAYVVTNGQGEATFKRYRADPPRLEPDSANPAHQPIILGREPFLIVGRVILAIDIL